MTRHWTPRRRLNTRHTVYTVTMCSALLPGSIFRMREKIGF